MKVNMEKRDGGFLSPFDDFAQDKINKLKTGCIYEVEFKYCRNPSFHGKVFSFLGFCFHFWKGNNEFMDEAAQFDVFRKNLTVLAGYYDSFYKIDGSVRIEAKSLSYGSMTQEDFERFYNAAIQAAMKHVFKTNDESIYNQLMSYF